MKKIKICGKEIREGVCSCLNARVHSKEFGEFLSTPFAEQGDNNITITELKIIELLNTADSWEVSQEKGNTYLHIDTKEYKIVVDIIRVKKEVA